MKKPRISRPVKYLYLFMVCVILFSMTTMLASASNYKDKHHTAQGYLTNGSLTDYEEKQDATSCYVYNNYSTCNVNTYVFGSYYSSGNNATNDTYYATPTLVRVGEEKYIWNLVYERGHTYAALQFWVPDSSQYEYLDLLWSPDSV